VHATKNIGWRRSKNKLRREEGQNWMIVMTNTRAVGETEKKTLGFDVII